MRSRDVAIGLGLLLACTVSGDAAARITNAPVPGMVLGLLLMLCLLTALGRVPRGLGVTARWLIQHMNLFYVPAAVGVTAYTRQLRADLWPIVAALLVGTWVALAAAAFTFRAVAVWLGKRSP